MTGSFFYTFSASSASWPSSKSACFLLLSCLIIGFACSAEAGVVTAMASSNSLLARSTRDAERSEDAILAAYDSISQALESSIPVMGTLMDIPMSMLRTWVYVFEAATNGILGKMLDGILPCTIDVTHITCNGTAFSPGGPRELLFEVIDAVPSIFLPSFAKMPFKLVVDFLLDPTAFSLFSKGLGVDDSA